MFWRIGEILVRKKWISWEQLQEALDEQKKTRELTGEILLKRGYISEHLLYKALAEQNNIAFVDLEHIRINLKAVELIPYSICQKYALIPVELREHILTIAISNPLNVWPESELKQLTKHDHIVTVLSTPTSIRKQLKELYAEEIKQK